MKSLAIAFPTSLFQLSFTGKAPKKAVQRKNDDILLPFWPVNPSLAREQSAERTRKDNATFAWFTFL